MGPNYNKCFGTTGYVGMGPNCVTSILVLRGMWEWDLIV